MQTLFSINPYQNGQVATISIGTDESQGYLALGFTVIRYFTSSIFATGIDK